MTPLRQLLAQRYIHRANQKQIKSFHANDVFISIQDKNDEVCEGCYDRAHATSYFNLSNQKLSRFARNKLVKLEQI